MVLIAAVVGADVFGGGHVGLVQVVGVSAQAAPAEGAVAVVEQARAKNILHVGREDEAVQVILAVLADALDAGVVHGLQEAVAVVEEVGAPVVELADHLIVVLQGLVYQLAEGLRVLVQHLGALGEGQALGAVAAVIGHVAGGLVAHEVHVDVVVVQILQQIHDVAVIGNGAGLARRLMLAGDADRLFQAVGAVADPALGIAGVDAGVVHLGNDGGGAGDLGGLALGAGHAAQAGGDEQAPSQISVVGNAQLQPAGV